MYLAKLKVAEIRGFCGPRTVDLDFARPDGSYAGWTVIAGRNGSGKTTLLRAMALTLADEKSVINMSPDYSTWRSSEETEGVIHAHFFLDEEELAELADAEPGVRPYPAGVHADIAIGLPVREGQKRDRVASYILATRSEGTVEAGLSEAWWQRMQADLPRSLNWFAAAYGPFRRLSYDAAGSTGSPQRSGTLENASRFATLFNEDASLAESVSWLIGLHLLRLEGDRDAEALLAAVLDLLGDGLLPDGCTVEKVNSKGLWVNRSGQSFALREMSDGYRTTAALVLDIARHLFSHYGTLRLVHDDAGRITVDLPGVVLIDEIDAHLHVTWQQRIGEWLKSRFPRVQFIVTTHSPYICQSADPAGLIRLPGPGEQRPAETVDDALHQRVVYGSGDDAILSDLFGMDSPYSTRAERVRQELVDLEEKVLTGEATEAEAQRYDDLSRRLNSSLSARVDEVAARLGGTGEPS